MEVGFQHAVLPALRFLAVAVRAAVVNACTSVGPTVGPMWVQCGSNKGCVGLFSAVLDIG